MGIKVTNQWVLHRPVAEADALLRTGLEDMGAGPAGPVGHIEGKTKAALLKNRYGAKITVELSEHPEGSMAEVTVDALGDKQQEILDELALTLPEGVLDDRGVSVAVAKLGKFSRLLGKRELAHLRSILNPEERVLALAQGTYEERQSLAVLTNQRLFFLEKGIVRESIQEFPLSVVSSLTLKKGWTGESLHFTASGATGTITHLDLGQGEHFANAYRQLRNQPVVKTAAPAPTPTPEADVMARLEQLGKLRDTGVLTEEEFATKKQELLRRL